MMRVHASLWAAVAAMTLPACGPKIVNESIAVNRTVHENVSDLRAKHVALVNAFFDLKREAFDAWFLDTYEPAYQENYAKVWAEQNDGHTFDISKAEHRQSYVQDIITEYDGFMAEIRAVEQELIAALETAYTDVLAANEAVTNLLVSAKAVSEAQRNLWDSTVGRVFPEFNASGIEQKVCQVRAAALRAVAGADETCGEVGGP